MQNNLFDVVTSMDAPRNVFDLSHDVKLSSKMGQLLPIGVFEALPGDKWTVKADAFVRFAPLLAPIMHKVDIGFDFFFVPNRLLWDEFEEWIQGQSESVMPFISANAGDNTGRVSDYMGLPAMRANTQINILPYQAYTKIYDEYYRDQNLQAEVTQDLVSGNNTSTHRAGFQGFPLNVAWKRDYFTSALPTPQKGDAVTIPLIDQNTVDVEYRVDGDPTLIRSASSGNLPAGTASVDHTNGNINVGGLNMILDPNGQMFVDLNAAASDIVTLRRAFKLQQFLEDLMRGGTRYTEYLRHIHNVVSSDARLQRPEYFGGSRTTMAISEVISTADTSASSGAPVGYLGGHGASIGSSGYNGIYCEEHGYIVVMMHVRPETAYQEQVPKHFLKDDYLDYYIKHFAHIGEQEIKNVEVYGQHTDPDGTFGYTPRYADYKYINSRVAGDFRNSLDFWHLSRQFTGDPALNSDFITCDPDTRIFAVTDPTEDHLWSQVYFDMKVVRSMPKFGNPKLV